MTEIYLHLLLHAVFVKGGGIAQSGNVRRWNSGHQSACVIGRLLRE